VHDVYVDLVIPDKYRFSSLRRRPAGHPPSTTDHTATGSGSGERMLYTRRPCGERYSYGVRRPHRMSPAIIISHLYS